MISSPHRPLPVQHTHNKQTNYQFTAQTATCTAHPTHRRMISSPHRPLPVQHTHNKQTNYQFTAQTATCTAHPTHRRMIRSRHRLLPAQHKFNTPINDQITAQYATCTAEPSGPLSPPKGKKGVEMEYQGWYVTILPNFLRDLSPNQECSCGR